MSNAPKLYKTIMADEAARTSILSAKDTASLQKAVLDAGEQFGLPVTLEEAEGFLRANTGAELSDDELEMVVGGKLHQANKDGSGVTQKGNDAWQFVSGKSFDDVFFATDQDDTVHGGKGDDEVTSYAGNDEIRAGEGNDTVYAGEGDDKVVGDEGDDMLFGDAGNDVVDGGLGMDELFGGTGNDTLKGGSGDDYLHGGEGNDVLIGGAGDDKLVGGAGSDVFVFGNDSGNDTISDFESGTDQLLFEGAFRDDLEIGVVDGNTVITFGDTQVTLQGVTMTDEQVWSHVITEMPK